MLTDLSMRERLKSKDYGIRAFAAGTGEIWSHISGVNDLMFNAAEKFLSASEADHRLKSPSLLWLLNSTTLDNLSR